MTRLEFFIGTESGAHGKLDRQFAEWRRKQAYAILAETFDGATEITTRGFWQEDPPERGLYFIVLTADLPLEDIKACAEELRVLFDQISVLVTRSTVECWDIRADA
jgi:hypothetical protein